MTHELLIHDGWQRCPYLDGRIARLPLYRQLERLSPEDADRRFAMAERRVGQALYRVACPTCSACEGIRLPVDQLTPTRSQRRALRRWEGLPWRIEVETPSVTAPKLALFHEHKQQRRLTNPDEPTLPPGEYEAWLVDSCLETIEMRYYLADRMIGLSIVDLGARSASSVYFYFDPAPDIARLSPGVFSIFQEVELCRRTGRRWLYLGLYAKGSPHLAYKADYYPHERRIEGEWRRFE